MFFIIVFTCRLLLKVNMFPLKFTSEKSTFNINTHMINNTHYWMKAGKISGLPDFLMKTQNSWGFLLFHLNFSWKCNLHHDMHLWQKKKKSSVTRVSLTCLVFFWYIYRLYCSKKLQASVQCEQIHNSHCIKLFGVVLGFFLFKISWLEIYK